MSSVPKPGDKQTPPPPPMVDPREEVVEVGKTFVAATVTGAMNTTEMGARVPEAIDRFIDAIVPDGIGETANQIRETVSQWVPEWALPVIPDPVHGVTLPSGRRTGGTHDLANWMAKRRAMTTEVDGVFSRIQEKLQDGEAAWKELRETGSFEGVKQALSDPHFLAAAVGLMTPTMVTGAAASRQLSVAGSTAFISMLEGMEVATDAADFESRTGVEVDPHEFVKGVARVGVINGFLERLGLGSLARSAAARSVCIRAARLLGDVITESATEGLQTVNTNFAIRRAYDPDRDIEDGVFTAMVGGAGAGPAMGGYNSLTSGASTTQTQSPDTKARARRLAAFRGPIIDTPPADMTLDPRGIAEVRSPRADVPKNVALVTPRQLKSLPNGTKLYSIAGEEVIKGVDRINSDTGSGFLAYGFDATVALGQLDATLDSLSTKIDSLETRESATREEVQATRAALSDAVRHANVFSAAGLEVPAGRMIDLLNRAVDAIWRHRTAELASTVESMDAAARAKISVLHDAGLELKVTAASEEGLFYFSGEVLGAIPDVSGKLGSPLAFFETPQLAVHAAWELITTPGVGVRAHDSSALLAWNGSELVAADWVAERGTVEPRTVEVVKATVAPSTTAAAAIADVILKDLERAGRKKTHSVDIGYRQGYGEDATIEMHGDYEGDPIGALEQVARNDKMLKRAINHQLAVAMSPWRVTKMSQFLGRTVSHGMEIDPYTVELRRVKNDRRTARNRTVNTTKNALPPALADFEAAATRALDGAKDAGFGQFSFGEEAFFAANDLAAANPTEAAVALDWLRGFGAAGQALANALSGQGVMLH